MTKYDKKTKTFIPVKDPCVPNDVTNIHNMSLAGVKLDKVNTFLPRASRISNTDIVSRFVDFSLKHSNND